MNRRMDRFMVRLTSLLMGVALGLWVAASSSGEQLMDRIVVMAIVFCFQSHLVLIAAPESEAS